MLKLNKYCLITVRHLLDVRLKTPRYGNSPHVSVPLIVQKMPGQPITIDDSGSSSSSYTDQAPYPIVGPVSAQPNPVVVQVPQSAGAIEVEALPDPSESGSSKNGYPDSVV